VRKEAGTRESELSKVEFWLRYAIPHHYLLLSATWNTGLRMYILALNGVFTETKEGPNVVSALERNLFPTLPIEIRRFQSGSGKRKKCGEK